MDKEMNNIDFLMFFYLEIFLFWLLNEGSTL